MFLQVVAFEKRGTFPFRANPASCQVDPIVRHLRESPERNPKRIPPDVKLKRQGGRVGARGSSHDNHHFLLLFGDWLGGGGGVGILKLDISDIATT